MTLDDYLRPVQALDRAVQKQYTRIGQKIPEDRLYKVTCAITFSGAFCISAAHTKMMVTAEMEPITTFMSAIATPWCLGWTDHYLNCMGLAGKLPQQQEETACIDSKVASYEISNRRLRLPYLLVGMGCMAKAAYEVAKYVTTAEPMDAATMPIGMYGYGLFALASSMYLKDQDPKLLKRAPKWKVLYRYARRKMNTMRPTPEPATDNA